VLPRVDRFEPPGMELFPQTEPRLFAEIKHVAALTGQRAPAHVYLVPDVNAFVTERGGVMGVGSRRVMGIGLPMFELLSANELRAVIAHYNSSATSTAATPSWGRGRTKCGARSDARSTTSRASGR
jgi:hypothetical protein